MAGQERDRMMSQSSSSSSDSSILDPSYAGVVDVESNQILLPQKLGYHKGEQSSSRRCSLPVVSLVVSVVCVVILVSCILSFMLLYSFDIFPGGPSDQERVCMPCGQVNPDPLAKAEFAAKSRILDIHLDKDGETEICCASTPAQYATLFKLILKRQEKVKQFADIMSNDTDDNANDGSVTGRKAVSAHLLAKPTRHAAEQTVQHWKSPSESPVSHVRGGLRFHNNTLYVKSEGFYFVYCQILFNRAPAAAEGNPEGGSPTRLASHYVKRHSLAYPASSGLLLKARHTRVSGQDDRHSSYVGGLFFLYSGDQLFVQVSVPELVSHDDRASFFGLFKVGN